MDEPEIYHVFNNNGRHEPVRGEDALAYRLGRMSNERLCRDIALYAAPQSKEARQAIEFAKMELDRRAAKDAEDLAKKTTWISVSVGAIAGIFGAVAGALIIVCFGSQAP